MTGNALQQEVERLRRRASKLGVDRLLADLWFDHGLRYYASWSKNPDYRLKIVDSFNAPSRDRLDLVLRGKPYSIRVEEQPSYESYDDSEMVTLQLRLGDDKLAFEETLTLYEDTYLHSEGGLVSAFIEGQWIDDFRLLEAEYQASEKARKAASARRTALADAERFGISPEKAAELSGRSASPDVGSGLADAGAVAGTGIGALILAGLVLLAILGAVGLLVFGLRQIF